MNKTQYIVIGSVITLFAILYFVCDTKLPNQRQVERTRQIQWETTDVNVLIQEAHQQLSADQVSIIQTIEHELSTAANDSIKLPLLQRLSGYWYEIGQPAISGHYAQAIADVTNTEDAWSIAGTTYAICVQRSEKEKERAFCNQRAIRAFENAISINANKVEHQVNLALTYTSFPPPNEPMKGILMLKELEQAFPTSALVLNTLARLAIQTGQYERAVQRLEKALTLAADNTNTICLLAQAYNATGNMEGAKAYDLKCREANQ